MQADPTSASPGPTRVAIVVAADDEMRILLRGLLQLHRVRVEAETNGVPEAVRLLKERRPTLVVTDVHVREGNGNEVVAAARRLLPGARVVLILPASVPPPSFPAESTPDVLLRRPFRIQQFAEAIGPSPPPGPLG